MSFEKTKESAHYFHENNIYFPTGTMAIFGDIDEVTSRQAILNLHVLDNYSTSSNVVTIFLNTEGGDISHGLAIYDAICAMKKYVRIVCFGEVSSMGTVILQAADERSMTPSSFLMIHRGEQATSGDPISKKNWDKFIDHQEEVCNSIYLEKIKQKKPRFTKDKLIEMLSHDTILLPKDALSLGLIDAILDGHF